MNEQTLKDAHAIRNGSRDTIMASEDCGCFHCLAVLKPDEITDFADVAICPRCGVDAILGSASGFPVTDSEFLKAMHGYWFDIEVDSEGRQVN